MISYFIPRTDKQLVLVMNEVMDDNTKHALERPSGNQPIPMFLRNRLITTSTMSQVELKFPVIEEELLITRAQLSPKHLEVLQAKPDGPEPPRKKPSPKEEKDGYSGDSNPEREAKRPLMESKQTPQFFFLFVFY